MTESSHISLVLNGERVEATGVSQNATLLDWLRARGLTGAKEGCAEGDCGACTVVTIDRCADGQPRYRSINSCIALLATLEGKEIRTVEGMRAATHHPVQEAMATHLGSQCGYCTPGFVASLFEGYYRDDISTLDDLNDQLCGNLCRCTGYRPIRDAALEAWRGQAPGKKAADPFGSRTGSAACGTCPVRFRNAAGGGEFLQPTTLDGFFKLLDEHPGAVWIAGGTEVGVGVAKMFHRHPVYIGLQRIEELLRIERASDALLIGGGVVLTDVMQAVRMDFPSLHEMLRWFASRPIRNRATLGGNLATASPIGDTAPVLLALGASLTLQSRDGSREVALRDFFTGYRKTVLRQGEIIRHVRIPFAAPGLRRLERGVKVSKRREMDISIVSAGFRIDLAGDGTVAAAGVGFGGVAATPVHVAAAVDAMVGREWGDPLAAEVAAILGAAFEPITDGRGTSDYRRLLPAGMFLAFAAGGPPEPGQVPLGSVEMAPRFDSPPHESGLKHSDGSAIYVDDEAERRRALVVWPVVSPHARARIAGIRTAAASGVEGVCAVLTAADVPGLNNTGPVRHDETLFADGVVEFEGHMVAAVVGVDGDACRKAAALVEVDYEPLEPVTGIRQAILQDSFHTGFNRIARGDAATALGAAPVVVEGEFAFGGQEHFYLETQAAHAEWTEDDLMLVHSSTQHPSEIQTIVSEVLGFDRNRVVVHSPRMGGGFGGKETQGNAPAALAALAVLKTGKACRVRLNRDQDIMMTGKRHPFLARFKAGFETDGRLAALDVELFSNGGWSLDLSIPICDRALFHLDNVYYIEHADFRGRVCKTNLPSNTAFRGFGGPQGMLVIEEIMDRGARALGLHPHAVRERNLYHGTGETNTTHYGQEIGDNRLRTLWFDLKKRADYELRRREVDDFNASSRMLKRGLAQTAVKFGISFTHTPYNQAGALVHVYTDGSVQVNHGGTEMGQGLHTKIQGVAARELGIARNAVRVTQTRTDKVPNTSATAASSGSDLNGAAVADACRKIRENLTAVAVDLLRRDGAAIEAGELVFSDSLILDPSSGASISLKEVVKEVYTRRMPLSATGYYRTPGIHYDREKGRGRPFFYFACGSAITEVEIDLSTGQTRLVKVDILHDVGESLNPGLDRGQIEGGYIQGFGWLTSEEVVWNEKGHILSHGASTYEIPTIGDIPPEFHVSLMENASQPGTIHGSKAVGEPPLMLAISAREAIRDAVAAARDNSGEIQLGSPATCEAVFRATRGMPPLTDGGRRLVC